VSRLFAGLQRLLPHHALSRGVGYLARSEHPWLRRPFIHTFARLYGVDMAEAERTSLDDYASFNDFFTRALRADARPLDPDPLALLSPVDGTVSQAGPIREDRLLQAKGHSYTLRSLVGRDCPELEGGTFVTVYLAPGDYHRIHLPADGQLVATTAIPGALFSVNARTEAAVTDLFCRNERLVCWFQTDFGPMLVVLIGALIVASIETVWGDVPSPYRREQQHQWSRSFSRGAEIGRFLLGSTVIVCCPPGTLTLRSDLAHGQRVRMGERLGELCC
jgi:phosphatidylserine decarboxylase